MQRPPENYPLQGGRGPVDGNVVISIVQHPNDYIVWSMATLTFGNPFCLGLLAYYFSIKARDRKMLGDLEGARSYGSTARCVNGWAVALIIISVIIVIIVVAVTVSSITSHLPSRSFPSYPYGY